MMTMTSNLTTPQGIPSVGPAVANDGVIPPRVGAEDASSTVNFRQPGSEYFKAKPMPPGLQRLERLNEASNSLAKSIHIADTTMQEIDENLDEMKNKLIQHLKQNPPYPPESEERVKMLKSLSSLRKLIDRLSFPPEDSGAAQIMGAPESFAQAVTPDVHIAGAHGEIISQT